MHGIIFQELQKFVEHTAGRDAWNSLLTEAGMSSAVFLPTQAYPDEQIVALVSTASKSTDTPAPALLEAFGKYIVADLLEVFGALVDPNWKTLDVIEHAESSIHTAVRVKEPTAAPPKMKCSRPNPDEVVIEYSSPRKLCFVAIGIAQGLAEHFQEKIEVSHEQCMHDGNPSCRLSVKQLPS